MNSAIPIAIATAATLPLCGEHDSIVQGVHSAMAETRRSRLPAAGENFPQAGGDGKSIVATEVFRAITSAAIGGSALPFGGNFLPSGGTPNSRGGAPVSFGGTPMSGGAAPISSGGFPISRGGTPVSSGDAPKSAGATPISFGGAPKSRGGAPIWFGIAPISFRTTVSAPFTPFPP